MGAHVVNLVASNLAERVAAASAWEPLSALAAPQRAELEAALDGASAFEDLPGKWQAAVLAAETARTGVSVGSARPCCR